MTELKTLKDIKGINEGKNADFIYEVKTEAVKWYKRLKKEYWSAEQFCEHFFNLTEEDLED